MNPYRSSAREAFDDSTIVEVSTFDWRTCERSVRLWRVALRCPTCQATGRRDGVGPWTEPSRPAVRCVNGHVMPSLLLGEPRL
jgi:hypothetical protein